MAPTSKINGNGTSYDERLDRIRRYLPRGITEKILSQRDKIEGERRQVTIMFCDMADSMPLIEKLGPEKSYGIMDQIYEIMVHKVHEYEGSINEMRGDGIMALFGAPIALEDAPQCALRSALAIQSEMRKFNEKSRGNITAQILFRIGINSGPVVVGAIGNDLRVQFTAVGDTINMAARMEQLAEPGTTFLTEETFKLTKDLFHFESMGEMKVKGKNKPVPVYKLVSAEKHIFRPRLGSERAIYSEMVGRDRELDRLELQVMKAINGDGSVVSIIGEAGIGKSRLVAELMRREVMRRVTLLEGRTISIGRNLSFYPIIDLLKKWARIRHDDGEATALGKLEIAVSKVSLQDVHEIFPFVATLMGMKPSGRYGERIEGIEGEALEKLILKNLRELLIKAAASTPLVIVVEDLHWADTSSIQLLESLFPLAETQRILFVNLFRPGYQDTGERLFESLRNRLPVYYVEIRLEPLSERTSEALINNMLSISGLHHTVTNQIVSRSGGNPFFIEEVVRAFIDEGAVVLKDGKFEVTDKIRTMAIPHTINDLLMARIDRLEEETRNLVKIASVIGRNFFYRVLSEVAETIDNIDHKLSYLKEMQLVRERRRMDEIEYLFKHTLVQEAAYESILSERRKELHKKVAEVIERIFRGRIHEFYGMLAYHYSKAENLEKTEAYLIKAGEEALRSSASSEALTYYQKGLQLYRQKYGERAEAEKLATFEKNIALALYNKGQLEMALEYFDKVLERWGSRSSKKNRFVVFKVLVDLMGVVLSLYLPSKRNKKNPTKRDNEIFDLRYKKALALVHLDPVNCFIEFINTLNKISKFDIAKVENGIGIWMSGSGLFSWTGISFGLSKKMLDYNKSVLNGNDVKEVLYYNLYELLVKSYEGDWLNVEKFDENLVQMSLRMGEFWHASIYLLFHGHIYIGQGAFQQAETMRSTLLKISKDYGNETGTESAFTLKIKLLLQSRKLHEALEEVEKAILFLTQSGRETVTIFYLGFKAVIQVRLMDFEGAEKTLRRTREIAAEKIRIHPNYISSSLLGQFLLDLNLLQRSVNKDARQDVSELSVKAYQSGRRAIKNSKKYAFDRPELFRLMGLYYWLVDKQAKAIEYWEKGIKTARQLGARVELARLYSEIGRRFRDINSVHFKLNGMTADEYLEKAKIIFGEIGLEKDLEKLDYLLHSTR